MITSVSFGEVWQMFTTTIGSAAVVAALTAVFFSSKKRRELHRKNKTAHRFLVAVVFGILSIYGTVSAVEVNGLLCNCRNLAPLYAGIVGGPIAGIGAGLIGGLFRFLVYGGPAGIPCSIACVVAGAFGAVMHLTIVREVRYHILTGAAAAIIVEVIHALIAIPFGIFGTAKLIVAPIMVANALGMMFCMYIYNRYAKQEHEN